MFCSLSEINQSIGSSPPDFVRERSRLFQRDASSDVSLHRRSSHSSDSPELFGRKKAKCDDSRSNERLRLDRKRTERRTHFLHTLSKHIVSECVERGVGTIVIGDLGGIRDDDNGESCNWGKHGNLDLHGWAFDRLTSILEYKAEAEGIDVTVESERDTSKTCSACGTKDGNQRVERGLYVCEECDTVANADVNGAENIRRKVTPSPSEDRSNGWLAQPSVHLFDRNEGRFAPREQVVDCKP
ncbi:RNA-guided endonuclease InsQ/TnpB family protein [Natronorubrum aibiense]|uniref:RNA-guided endonuclease InsQ/TnpB family protein n=1 Tax=Natronorubrum aibiense TaxID=348826 RepID=UPI003742E4C4